MFNSDIHFYCVDYNFDTGGGPNWPGAVCYPRLRKYETLEDFFDANPEARERFKNVDISDIDFYECDYDEASLGFDIDDLICIDIENDMWAHKDMIGD